MKRALIMALITIFMTSAVVTPEQNHQIWRVVGPVVTTAAELLADDGTTLQDEAEEGQHVQIRHRQLGDNPQPPYIEPWPAAQPSGVVVNLTPAQWLCLRRLLNEREMDYKLHGAAQSANHNDRMPLAVQDCS